ncbi:MAG: hypothetical protein IPM23_11360 [Candidatus Melainabacteria bacterium]|nr:hypothetical protein [Candidatus Melainabacteria bacterium]
MRPAIKHSALLLAVLLCGPVKLADAKFPGFSLKKEQKAAGRDEPPPPAPIMGLHSELETVPPVLSDIQNEAVPVPPVLSDIQNEAVPVPPVLTDIQKPLAPEAVPVPPVLSDIQNEAVPVPPVLTDIQKPLAPEAVPVPASPAPFLTEISSPVPGGTGSAPVLSEIHRPIEPELDVRSQLSYYYKKGNPDKVPALVLRLEAAGELDNNKGSIVLIHFLAELFKRNPDRISTWSDQMMQLARNHQGILWHALWYADTDGSRAELNKIARVSDTMAQRDIAELLSYHPAPVMEEIFSLDVLDRLWGSFLASGDSCFVQRIIKALPLRDSDAVPFGQLLASAAARSSLANNCQLHELVRQICVKERDTNPDLKKYLDDVLSLAASRQKAQAR